MKNIPVQMFRDDQRDLFPFPLSSSDIIICPEDMAMIQNPVSEVIYVNKKMD